MAEIASTRNLYFVKSSDKNIFSIKRFSFFILSTINNLCPTLNYTEFLDVMFLDAFITKSEIL